MKRIALFVAVFAFAGAALAQQPSSTASGQAYPIRPVRLVIPWPPGPLTMDPRCGFVFNVYTVPAHRQQGLARRLMDAMHDWCRGEGIERVALNASTFGQPLYEQMGYTVTHEPMMRMRL